MNKNLSIEELYLTCHKHILLVKSYTEITQLPFIIKGCRLKPFDNSFLYKKRTTLLRHWVDEFGNSLKIINKDLLLVLNDLSVDRKEFICTDLYYGFSLKQIFKISKLAHFFIGFDEDLRQEFLFLTFLGFDNYLRSFMLMYGEWQQVSPLLLGIDNLLEFSDNIDVKYFMKINIYKNYLPPCINKGAWITSVPLDEDLLGELVLFTTLSSILKMNISEQNYE